MEDPEEFYRELEKLRRQFRDLGYNLLKYNLLKLIGGYQRAGFPLGRTGEGFRVWTRYRQWTTVN